MEDERGGKERIREREKDGGRGVEGGERESERKRARQRARERESERKRARQTARERESERKRARQKERQRGQVSEGR